MATVELVQLVRTYPETTDQEVIWPATPAHQARPTPLIFWSNGWPWREANLWISQKASSTKFATLASLMSHMLAYAKWLERNQIDWWHFPELEQDRCLYRYRGALKSAMDHGEISPKTASNRIRALVQFYRWVSDVGLLSVAWPKWQNREIGIRLTDRFGFERTLYTQSTNLAISAKSSLDTKLENGLYPVSHETERAILQFVQDHGSIELFHFLSLGFRTGMRLGTLADLKILTLQRATPDPLMGGFYRIQVGPNAHPPVATKGGVNGAIRIHHQDLDQLLAYATSTRRLSRQIRASPEKRTLVFLTKAGRPYAGSDQNNYRAVEMELSRLRRLAASLSDPCLVDFHFHRSRASFGTNTARVLLAHLPTDIALQLLQELMLHANLETTLKYIKFAQTSSALEEASDAFTRSFLKLSSGEVRLDP